MQHHYTNAHPIMEPFITPITDSNWPNQGLIDQHSQQLGLALGRAGDAYAVDPTLWQALLAYPHTLNAMLWSLAREGYLPVINLAPDAMPPFQSAQPTKEQKALLPPSVVEAVSSMPRPPKSMYCFTRGESWWSGPLSFLVQDDYTFYLWQFYERARKSAELQMWKPKGAKIKQSKGPNTLYEQWLALCAERRAQSNALQDQLEAAQAHVMECRSAIRKHEAEAVTWAEYQKGRTM